MGRKKIQITRIMDERNRQVSHTDQKEPKTTSRQLPSQKFDGLFKNQNRPSRWYMHANCWRPRMPPPLAYGCGILLQQGQGGWRTQPRRDGNGGMMPHALGGVNTEVEDGPQGAFLPQLVVFLFSLTFRSLRLCSSLHNKINCSQ